MSIHSSLKSHYARQKRNVLKRSERVKLLKAGKKWKRGNSLYGLPKVKPTQKSD